MVYGGFKEVDGCVFLREQLGHHDTLSALDLHRDRTGYEAAVNKIFLEHHLEPGMPREAPALALTAEKCAAFLAERLTMFSKDSFLIISSVDERSCALRFHKVRQGERWIKDINTYDQPILVVDVNQGT
ncbi:MAG: hypothetical protein KF773_27405 [Deltaproteobacteria bacterium]|nr:hypothetical protein [Deltaproteobacteria bacterium]